MRKLAHAIVKNEKLPEMLRVKVYALYVRASYAWCRVATALWLFKTVHILHRNPVTGGKF